MCGEDASCLSTVGQRSSARWVLAHGVGKVGSALLLSALFIDVTTGKEVARGSRRIAESAPDWEAVTRSLADEVVKRPIETPPQIVEVPVRVEVPVPAPEKPRRLRTVAWISSGVTVAFAAITVVLGLLAAGNYQSLQKASAAQFDELARNQRLLNGAADTMLAGTVLGIGSSLLFFLLDWRLNRDPPPPEPVAAW
jgi:hypothetical protein